MLVLIPPSIRRKIEMCRLWNHLMDLDSERLPKIVFNYELVEKNSWGANMLSIFNQINESKTFNEREKNPSLFNIEQKLLENHEKTFLEGLPTKLKLRNYALHKFSFKTEDYVMKYYTRNKKSLFAQLRCGILPLKIETGRYTNTPLTERKCDYCIEKYIEDEFHFVFKCSFYSELRAPFFEQCLNINPEFENLDEIERFRFVLSNEDITNDAVNFISTAFNKRKWTK